MGTKMGKKCDGKMIHKLYNGDCLEIMKQIDDKSIDCIICDPPYNKTACEWDKSIIPFHPMWEHIERITKPNANIIFTASQPFTSMLIMSKPEWFRYEIIWKKKQATAPLVAKIRPMPIHENILVFYDKKGIYNPQMTEGKPYSGFSSKESKIGEVYGELSSIHNENLGTRYPTSVVEFGRERGGEWDGKHPTQKPLGLLMWLVSTYTKSGDNILDFTAGVGSTGHAALLLKRNFIGIEKEISYYNIMVDRLDNIQNLLKHQQF